MFSNDREMALLRSLYEALKMQYQDQIAFLAGELKIERDRFDVLHNQMLEMLGVVRRETNTPGQTVPTNYMQLPRNSWAAIRDKLEKKEADKAAERWQQRIQETEKQIANYEEEQGDA